VKSFNATICSVLLSGAALAAVGAGGCGSRDTADAPKGGLGLIDPNAPPAGALSSVPAAPVVPADPDAPPLTVVSMLPQGPLEGPVHPVVTFSHPVVALGTLAETKPPPLEITPAIKGAWRWLGSSSAEFVPEQTVPLSTQFTVRVPAGLLSLSGGTLKEEVKYTFATPTIAPQYGGPVNPYSQYAWARADQKFEVTFSQKPTDASLAKHVVLRGPDKAEIAVKVLRSETQRAHDLRLAKETGSDAETIAALEAAPVVIEGIEDHRMVLELTPVTPLALGTHYDLVFKAGLESAEGPLTLATEVAWGFNTYGPLKVVQAGCHKWGGGCPTGPISIELSNPVTAKALKAALTIEPAVKLAWPDDLDDAQSSFMLDGTFKPASEYKITLADTLLDEFGQKLGAAFTGPFVTGSFSPSVNSRGDRALLEKGLRAAWPLSHVNVSEIEVGFQRLDTTTALPWMENPWRTDRKPDFITETKTLPGARNLWQRSPVDLDPLFAKTGGAPGMGQFGLLHVAWGKGKERQAETTVVQVTNLSVHMKLGAARSEVFVWHMADGTPAKDAAVELVDVTGKKLAEGRTDADGILGLPGVGELPLPQTTPEGYTVWGPPFLAARVKAGDDVAIATTSDASWDLSPYRFDINEAWESTPPVAEGLVFTDRGIYRPGEPVYVKGILRERSLGKLRTPAGRGITVALVDPRGNAVSTLSRTVSAFGGFDAQFDLPAETELGYHQIKVEDAPNKLSWYTSLRVAEFRAPEFLVKVNAHDASKLAGDPVKGVVEGRYLFGAAMSGAQVGWSLTSSPGRFTPTDAQGFVYGETAPWWEENEFTTDGALLASGKGQLDPKGELVVEAGKARTPENRPQVYTLEASVTDVNRQEVAGRKSFTIHPAAFYVGLRGPGGFAEAKQPFNVDVMALKSEGEQRHTGAKVTVTLKRHEWNTVQKQTLNGTFETVSEPSVVDAGTCTVTTTNDPVPCKLTTEKPGYHELVAEATDAAGRKTRTNDSVWVGGEGYAAWLQDDDNKVEIVSDKTTYDIGDKARFLVQSPYPEAEAWVTVEREGVLSHQRVRLKGTATPIVVPIDESMIPNVFVGVVLARGRVSPPGKGADPGRPSFRVGYREIRVVPSEKRLDVTLTPDAPEKRPGSDLSIAVQVADRRKKGARAEVTVWAVDEGVLALTGYEAPDPVEALFHRRGLSVRQATNLASLVPQLDYGEKGKEQGGGGGPAEAEEMRSRFVTTPIFVGASVTGDDGRTTVTGKLPDNLTTFRLMAVAVTDADKGGRGVSKVVVNKPLMARPALPRAVRVGDKFAAGAVIHSQSKEAVKVTVKPVVAEGGLTLLDSGPREITVQPDKGTEVRFAFEAKAPGTAKLRFVAEGPGGASDAVEVPLNVTLPMLPESVAVFGDTAESINEGLKIPGADQVRDDAGGLTVTLASSALSGLGDAATGLIDYPYGCLEQQSSRLVPFVALHSLMEQYGKSLIGERDPREVVSKAVKEIAAMQTGDGGFAYWPGGHCASYFGTAYATLSLGEASKAGYLVDQGVLERARKYLVDAYPKAQGCEWSERSDDERALALYTLARQDVAQRELGRQLFERRKGMAVFSRALLASSLALARSDAAATKTMITELMNDAKVEPGKVHFAEANPDTYAPLFSTNVRTTAIVLQALLDGQPDHPFVPQIAHFLVGARQNGGYETTQEAAFALMSLADFARIREAETPAFTATVKAGGEALLTEKFEGRSLAPVTTKLDWARLRKLPTPAPMAFEVAGKGRLYYGALLRYVPKVMPTDAVDRGLVVQRWYEPLEQPGAGQLRAVTEGDLLRVRVRLATSQMRHFVALEDPLPGGLEAVDQSLATSARRGFGSTGANTGLGEDTGSAALDGGDAGWYSAFDRVEMRDDRVMLFADHLPPGVHNYSYVARATTAGTFVLKPANAEGMYQPSVFGRSDGGTFWVHPRMDLSAR
jgi:uncharacterized protein YfaS (alpha-2-macroglobulin family)